MTSKHNSFRFGAVTATTSLVAGVAAVAFAAKLEADPLALTTRSAEPVVVAPSETDTWVAPVAQAWIDMAHAVASRASPGYASFRAPELANPTPQSCVPHWEKLEMGPVGRHVALLCRGTAILALPPPVARREAKVKLPTPGQLAPGVNDQRLPADLEPQAGAATEAAEAADNGVKGQWLGLRSPDSRQLPDSATQITYVDPLGWTVSS